MIKVTKNQSNSAIVSAGHNRLAELLQLPTKCRCNNLQNRFATTYKNILQFYAKSTCKKHVFLPDRLVSQSDRPETHLRPIGSAECSINREACFSDTGILVNTALILV